MLSLVLMQALDLHVEEGIGRDLHADEFADAGGQAHLVVALDGEEAILEGWAVRQFVEGA